MAQLTSPRLAIPVSGRLATPSVSVKVVLETEREISLACRGGCLVVICELREWDRMPGYIHSTLLKFPVAKLQSREFSGGRVADVTFTSTVTRKSLREDLAGKQEVQAVAWLFDHTSGTRVEIDGHLSNVVRLP